MNLVPWSSEEERFKRWDITVDRLCILVSVCCILGGAAFRSPQFSFVSTFLLAFWVWMLFRDRDKLCTMLQNKPRNMANLTTWVRLRPWQEELMCGCGASVHMNKAKWCPNPADAGGGRFSIVCPCGVGYYKLKS